MKPLFILLVLCFTQRAAFAQAFVSGMGGVAALSNAAAASPAPLAASLYDAKVGPALNLSAGYHVNDWLSLQVGYIWNSNRVTTTEIAGGLFKQHDDVHRQTAAVLDTQIYFRPRASRLRPYLSTGPALVRIDSEYMSGLRVAVGIDLMARKGWGFRYSFSEMISSNPLARQLDTPSKSGLMNFQNLFGVVKTFGR